MSNSTNIVVAMALVATSLTGAPLLAKKKPALEEEAPISFDGLYRVEKSIVDEAYIRPDLDLSGYGRIMIDPVTVSYKRKPIPPSASRASHSRSNFALTEKQTEELKGLFHEAFQKAMSEGEVWQVVDSTGPDVLRVQAELIDLVVKVPTVPSPGRSSYFVSELGEVTLVAELRDSQSGQILARGVDRRVIGRAVGGRVYRATTVAARSDVSRLFDAWAQLLRARLDQIKTITSGPND
jgi:hypothetical protein